MMNISRSSYYKWLQSSPSQKQIDKQQEDERIITRIKEISHSNNSLFGTMTMYYTLRNEGYKCGHNRVYRLMSINDIKSSYRNKSRNKYTKSNPNNENNSYVYVKDGYLLEEILKQEEDLCMGGM